MAKKESKSKLEKKKRQKMVKHHVEILTDARIKRKERVKETFTIVWMLSAAVLFVGGMMVGTRYLMNMNEMREQRFVSEVDVIAEKFDKEANYQERLDYLGEVIELQRQYKNGKHKYTDVNIAYETLIIEMQESLWEDLTGYLEIEVADYNSLDDYIKAIKLGFQALEFVDKQPSYALIPGRNLIWYKNELVKGLEENKEVFVNVLRKELLKDHEGMRQDALDAGLYQFNSYAQEWTKDRLDMDAVEDLVDAMEEAHKLMHEIHGNNYDYESWIKHEQERREQEWDVSIHS